MESYSKKIEQQYDNAQNHMEMALRLGSRFCQDCLEEGTPSPLGRSWLYVWMKIPLEFS